MKHKDFGFCPKCGCEEALILCRNTEEFGQIVFCPMCEKSYKSEEN